MIIVTGAVHARTETLDELLEASLAHVRRSRAEAGCVSHSVQTDAEDPLRLFFFEEWETMGALQAHFRQPDSATFMSAVRRLSVKSEKMRVYSAGLVELPAAKRA